MKVLNVAWNDYANFSHDNANALRSIGIDCEDVKKAAHVFKYDSESEVLPMELIIQKIEKADLVQIMHSDHRFLTVCKALKKRVFVYHTGTNYRRNYSELNKIFNPHVERSIIALGEFAGLGSKNETYMVGAVDTDKLKDSVNKNENIIFAHYPSCETTKGTDVVQSVVKFAHFRNKNFSFYCSTKKVTYKEQIERMKACNVYIEMFAPKQGKFNYGSWGITALEAAALAKIVITNHTTVDVYKKWYGKETPFIVCNTEKDLYNAVEELANTPISEIWNKQIDTRRWVEEYHSYKATANRLIELL